jgi:hypothetical protein
MRFSPVGIAVPAQIEKLKNNSQKDNPKTQVHTANLGHPPPLLTSLIYIRSAILSATLMSTRSPHPGHPSNAPVKTYEVPRVSPYERPFRIAGVSACAILLFGWLVAALDPPGVSDSIKHNLGMLVLATLIVAIPAFTVLAGLESEWKRKRSFSIEMSDDKIVKKRDGATVVELPFHQIRSITRSSRYLLITGGEPLKGLLVPKQIIDYKEFEHNLSVAAHINIEPRRAKPPTLFLAVFAFVSAACVFLVASRSRAVIAVSTGAVLLVQILGVCFLIRLKKIRNKYALVLLYIGCVSATLWLAYSRLKP